jgi:hypothetical protein
MPAKRNTLWVAGIALLGALSVDALLVLFPRTFYERVALGDQYPSGRQFIFGMSEKYTADFNHVVSDLILASIFGLFIAVALYAFIRKQRAGCEPPAPAAATEPTLARRGRSASNRGASPAVFVLAPSAGQDGAAGSGAEGEMTDRFRWNHTQECP